MAPYRQEAVEPEVQPDQWVDAYGDYLYRYAYIRLRESAAAEEAVQETFLSAIRHLANYDGSGSQLAWLLGILKRKILDAIRLRQKLGNIASLNSRESEHLHFNDAGRWIGNGSLTLPADFAYESIEFVEIVQNCLATLSATQADVFVLSVMEEHPTEVICKELEISPNTLWARLHRARLNLAKCVSLKLDLKSGEKM